jgi:glycosyltransferase involved in cell wall biosynthesis
MSDLLVSTDTPTLGTGRALRTYGIVRALALSGPLDLLYVRFGDWSEPGPEYRELERVRLHAVEPSRGVRRGLAYLRARFGRVPPAYARGISPELVSTATRLARDPDRGRVIADSPTVAAALARLGRRRGVIYNAHNLESSFRHELDSHGLGSPRALAAFERRLLLGAAESWFPSHADVAQASELAPSANLRYVPNVVDVSAIDPVTPQPGARRVLLVADYTYEPNRRAMRFLVDEVLPRLWTEQPDAELALVGRALEASPSDDGRVEVLGFVEDLRTAYASAACVVVPTHQGGGSSLKFIEALAYGVPVVATPQAAAGLEARPGQDYLEAATAEEFADQVAAVLRGEAVAVARRGRELAERKYSIDALAEAIAS